MLIPSDTEQFYTNADKSALYQGDIIRADGIGLKDPEEAFSPDHWMIITKSCDLQFDSLGITRKQNISILPLFTLKILKALFDRDLSRSLSKLRHKIVIIAIQKVANKFTTGKVDNIICDKYSKFMFLPYDGVVFKEPMVVDFDLVMQLDGSDEDLVTQILSSKELQLVSPFREKFAQRFALHYSSIGIDDTEIRGGEYAKGIKEYMKNQNK